ncbi:Leucine-, isoleucine-, valine-, threonine-, and alanine-binding protein [bacterium HR24]|jgi:ABC-type branched-subunit amino acid transport system substrate-binding protein|nr:Leucine-, isoleucine-, valine-, threonine-, and alanine-binding protein [bacterium HR24]
MSIAPKRLRPGLFFLPVVLTALVLAVACGEEAAAPGAGTPSVPVEPGQLRIALLVPFTGALAPFGPDFANAANLAVEHINAAGGVLGKPVRLIIGDDGTNPDQGVAEARRLVDIERVSAIVGAAASGVTLPIAESVTVPKKIVQISPSATSPALTTLRDDDYLFRTPISDAAQGVVLARLVRELGFSKVCTMYVNNAYGQGLSETFTRTFQQLQGSVTAQVSHTATTAPSYASELQRCVSGGPEALVAISYPEGQADVYLREALERNLVRNFVFVDGTKSADMFAKLGWDRFNGMKGTAPGALQTDAGRRFDDLFEQKYRYRYQNPFVRESYDAVMVIALAAEKAQSTDPTKIRDALRDIANAPGRKFGPGPDDVKAALEAIRRGEDIDYDGASGSVEFDRNGDVTIGAIEVWRVDAAARRLVTESVYRVDLSKSPPEVTRAQ